ncbi:hypothetical protein IWQ61_002225 [Dispira simplex]|nr:hypothetical protein IWQ61_002225 [Dispira simplex]
MALINPPPPQERTSVPTHHSAPPVSHATRPPHLPSLPSSLPGHPEDRHFGLPLTPQSGSFGEMGRTRSKPPSLPSLSACISAPPPGPTTPGSSTFPPASLALPHPRPAQQISTDYMPHGRPNYPHTPTHPTYSPVVNIVHPSGSRHGPPPPPSHYSSGHTPPSAFSATPNLSLSSVGRSQQPAPPPRAPQHSYSTGSLRAGPPPPLHVPPTTPTYPSYHSTSLPNTPGFYGPSSAPSPRTIYPPQPYRHPPNRRHSPIPEEQPVGHNTNGLPPPSYDDQLNKFRVHTIDGHALPTSPGINPRHEAELRKVYDACHVLIQFASYYMNSRNRAEHSQPTLDIVEDMVQRSNEILGIFMELKAELARPQPADDAMEYIRNKRTILTPTRSKYRKRTRKSGTSTPGRCHSCNISETPEWRRGPDGARTLCNACGLHYAKLTKKRSQEAALLLKNAALSKTSDQDDTIGNGNGGNVPTPETVDLNDPALAEFSIKPVTMEEVKAAAQGDRYTGNKQGGHQRHHPYYHQLGNSGSGDGAYSPGQHPLPPMATRAGSHPTLNYLATSTSSSAYTAAGSASGPPTRSMSTTGSPYIPRPASATSRLSSLSPSSAPPSLASPPPHHPSSAAVLPSHHIPMSLPPVEQPYPVRLSSSQDLPTGLDNPCSFRAVHSHSLQEGATVTTPFSSQHTPEHVSGTYDRTGNASTVSVSDFSPITSAAL